MVFQGRMKGRFFLVLLLILHPGIGYGEEPSPCGDELARALEAVKKRMEALDKREEELLKEEARLKEMEKMVEERMARLEGMRKGLEELLARIRKAREEGMAGLAKIYGNMPPEEAAARLEKMDEGLAIALIDNMSPRIAGRILALVEPAKAARLTQRMGKRYLSGRSQ